MWISCNLVVVLLQVGGSPGCLRRGLRCWPRHFAPLWARLEGTQDCLQPPLSIGDLPVEQSPPPACKYGQLTPSAIIIIDEEPEAGEVDLGGLKVFLVRQAEGVVVLTEPRQQVAAEGRCPCLGDCNDMICRYIVYIIYRSSCLSRTTRSIWDIAIFQQYVLVI